MAICEYCGTDFPDAASFCGHCGRAPARTTGDNVPTSFSLSPFAASGAPSPDVATVLTASAPDYPPLAPVNRGRANPAFPDYYGSTLSASSLEEEEEEKRRRAALLGLGLVGGFAGDMQQGNVPVVQGTPQMGNVPSVQGAPSVGGAPTAQGFPGSPGTPFAPPAVGNFPPVEIPPSAGFGSTAPQPPAHPTHPTSPRPPHPNPAPGCAPLWLIIVAVIILIITSFITAFFTIFSPAISLSGSGDVPTGGTLHLYGSHFLPGGSVTLTLDGSTPLIISAVYSNSSLSMSNNVGMQATTGEVWTLANRMTQMSSTSSTIQVGGDGSFTAAIAVEASWKIGPHTIRASESHNPRSAELNFNVVTPGTTPTASPSSSPSPSATTTVTVTPSPSPSPSATVTATTTTTGLSCINPNTVTLGPVSEGYNQTVSSVVTLCTSGSNVVNWTASWNQNAAPWLKLDRTSGQIQAPGQQQVTLSASASSLKVGNFSTTVTFSDQQDNSSETATVNLTVQKGCVNAVPTSLSFSGEAGVSDPAKQTVSVTNCGSLAATWSASVATDSGGNWLSISSNGGTLNSSAAQNVTVTASNLAAKLSAGTYTGHITFAVGSTQSTVQVTLTVQAAPTLVVESPSPPTFNADQSCSFNGNSGLWTCTASIANSSSSQSLNWTSSSSGISGIVFKPASGTLGPNQGTRVQIYVPSNNCQAQATLTFSGPANSDNITWYCTVIG
ncbi:MAG TPA: hypothetical protein VFQ30_13905 [Ktedonobacteraceae bacterium]|nr:hypothetical protein [Ktedonobacteraceae bacterium]